MKTILHFLIFPGFIFSLIAGLIAGWVDRKVSARIQFRVGPPWHQNFTDIVKLLGKEIIYPIKATPAFLIAPYAALISVALAAGLITGGVCFPSVSFNGDLMLTFYLLSMPAMFLVLGAASSKNPLACIGAEREMKLLSAYELPFILSMLTVVVKSSGALQISRIAARQEIMGSNIFSISGGLAFIVAILCMQAKLGFVPFDVSEAEQEIAGGALVEYSGLFLAFFKIVKSVLLFIVPALLILLFLGKDLSFLFFSLKYVIILVIIILIKNTSPRVNVDQARGFFLRFPTWAGMLAVALALMGL